MASTYTPIATYTVSGTSTSTVSFSSFSGYTDIRAVLNLKQSGSTYNFRVRVNSDTGSNYSLTSMNGDGSSAASSRQTSQTGWIYPDLSTDWSLLTFDFQNYSSTSVYKTALARLSAVARGYSWAGVLLWRSTSAISTIAFDVNSEYFLAGSTFTLYGIKAA